MKQRIAKYIARTGFCSRRDAEKLIAGERVRVQGKIVTNPALKIDDMAALSIDNVLLKIPEKTRLWRYHKPTGFLVTEKDPQNRPMIFDILPKNLPRMISVGRLDMNSEGLLLLTNDGGLARQLELPGWERRYRVRAYGVVDEKKIDDLRRGIVIDGVKYRPIRITCDQRKGKRYWFTIILQEGKNREIRHLLAYIDLSVTRIIRTGYGPFELGSLHKKAIEEVSTDDIKMLQKNDKGLSCSA